MKEFSGYKEAATAAKNTGAKKLPKGAYAAKILGVKLEEEKYLLTVQFDLTDGEFKDWFQKQFEANTDENKKYKGTVKIWLPKEDGTEKDQWTKNTFARWTNALEESNSGYHWDWDEKKWKGKKIGLVFGETGTIISGKKVVYTEVHYPVAVGEIKDIKPESIKFKSKNGYDTTPEKADGSADFMAVEGDMAELPF